MSAASRRALSGSASSKPSLSSNRSSPAAGSARSSRGARLRALLASPAAEDSSCSQCGAPSQSKVKWHQPRPAGAWASGQGPRCVQGASGIRSRSRAASRRRLMVLPPRRVPGSTKRAAGSRASSAVPVSSSFSGAGQHRGSSSSSRFSRRRTPPGPSSSSSSSRFIRRLSALSSLSTLAAVSSQGRRWRSCRSSVPASLCSRRGMCSSEPRSTRTCQTGWPRMSPQAAMTSRPSSMGCTALSTASTWMGRARHSGRASHRARGTLRGPEPPSSSRGVRPFFSQRRGSGRGRERNRRARRSTFQGRK